MTTEDLNNGDQSTILKVSVRGWLAILLVYTMCVINSQGIEVPEPLRSAVMIALGFYFGQKGK